MRAIKTLTLSLGFFFLFIAIYFFASHGFPKKFPVNTAGVSKIEFYEHGKRYEITNKRDIQDFMTNFEKIKVGFKESPSCPFGLPVVFFENEKRVEMILGTDDCGRIKYQDYYFNLKLPIQKVKKMQNQIRKTGLDFDKVRG